MYSQGDTFAQGAYDSVVSTGEVERVIAYYKIDDDQFLEDLQEEERVKAYRYGSTLVPFHDLENADLKIQTYKSLSIIGSVHLSQIPRESWMSGIVRVDLDSEPYSGQDAEVFSALLHGMYEKESGLLVRYVRCANAVPRLGLLLPVIKREVEFAYITWLPYSQDIRHYSFAPLDLTKRFQILGKSLPDNLRKEFVDDQVQASIDEQMDAWIDSLDLMNG